ncbi:hypothetical protein RY27_29210 [Litorilinea aerophila]|nr:hypothetical protein RY27_29210 [Litorilinea aerophila]
MRRGIPFGEKVFRTRQGMQKSAGPACQAGPAPHSANTQKGETQRRTILNRRFWYFQAKSSYRIAVARVKWQGRMSLAAGDR